MKKRVQFGHAQTKNEGEKHMKSVKIIGCYAVKTPACCICRKRLPNEKAMNYRGNWYCHSCEDLLLDDAMAEFRRRHYKRVGGIRYE